jgi:hypothetical protein
MLGCSTLPFNLKYTGVVNRSSSTSWLLISPPSLRKILGFRLRRRWILAVISMQVHDWDLPLCLNEFLKIRDEDGCEWCWSWKRCITWHWAGGEELDAVARRGGELNWRWRLDSEGIVRWWKIIECWGWKEWLIWGLNWSAKKGQCSILLQLHRHRGWGGCPLVWGRVRREEWTKGVWECLLRRFVLGYKLRLA